MYHCPVCGQGERLHIMPAVKDQHRICITFQLPSLHSQYSKKADEYLSHLIGHEGAGSLLSSLKARAQTLLYVMDAK